VEGGRGRRRGGGKMRREEKEGGCFVDNGEERVWSSQGYTRVKTTRTTVMTRMLATLTNQ